MIDSVKVVYGFSVGKVSFNQMIERLSLVAKAHHADFDLRLTKNSVTINVYPFKHSSAKEISEKDGAEIMRSIIYLCENLIDDGVLWSVEMSSALPF